MQLKQMLSASPPTQAGIVTPTKRIFSSNIVLRKQLQIYTDWANHYLHKRYQEDSGGDQEQVYANQTPSARLVNSLATDLQDGVLLVLIVESVTDSTLEGVTRPARTPSHMIANIDCCIRFLSDLGVNVKGIHAKDIHEGNLKSILTLFFNISRYKQSVRSPTGPLQRATPDTSDGDSAHRSQTLSLLNCIRPATSAPCTPPVPSDPCSPEQCKPSLLFTNTVPPSAAMISRLPSSSPLSAGKSSSPGSKASTRCIPVATPLSARKSSLSRTPAPCPVRASSSPPPNGDNPPAIAFPSSGLQVHSAVQRVKCSSVPGKSPRPSSTSSIPQIGNPSKPAVVFRPKAAPNSGRVTSKLASPAAVKCRVSEPSRTGLKSRLVPSQSEANLRKVPSESKSPSTASTPKSRLAQLSSQLRRPAPAGSRIRPTSSIIESTVPPPAMLMSSSTHPGHSAQSPSALTQHTSISKPTATVKAMVTPMRAPAAGEKPNSPPCKKSEGEVARETGVTPPPGHKQTPGTCPEEDSASSGTSDTESALASIEPMPPLLERPLHFGKSAKPDPSALYPGSNPSLYPEQSLYVTARVPLNDAHCRQLDKRTTGGSTGADFSDNSESGGQSDSSSRTVGGQKGADVPSAALITQTRHHLSDSNTLLNLHLARPRKNVQSGELSSASPLHAGLDETSSLSSDPGMVSGTDVSATSSSLCSEQACRKGAEIRHSTRHHLSSSSTELAQPQANPSKPVHSGTLPLRLDPSDPRKSARVYSNSARSLPARNSKLRAYLPSEQVCSDSECQRALRVTPKLTPAQPALYGNLAPSQHCARNAFTDTESVDSLTLGSNCDLGHPANLPLYANYHHLTPLSKPGDLICEYESVNRLRDTLSASPSFKADQQAAYMSGHFRNGSVRAERPPMGHLGRARLDEQSAGSSVSLLSTSSSLFASPEEKYIQEIRKLRRELDQANEKVFTLTSQLTANAHMVAAFEQSLSSMTSRLHQLSNSSELKDCELDRLRKTIESLKQQGGTLVDAAKSRTMSHLESSKFQRHLSSESVDSLSSCGEQKGSKKKSKVKLSANNTSWIRSSFSRAFKKSKTPEGKSASAGREIVSDTESGQCHSANEASDSHSVPSSPLLSARPSQAHCEQVRELRKQLREKDMQLTDMRLESLTSAHQLENLKETISEMRVEMLALRQDNDRLQRLASHKSLTSSQSSMTSALGSSAVVSSSTAVPPSPNDNQSLESVEMDSGVTSPADGSVKMVTLGSGSHTLATLSLSPKTNWAQLDQLVKGAFKDHLIRVDSGLALGVTVDSLACYRVGAENVQRNFGSVKTKQTPELLPIGYLVGESHINLQFKSAHDSLAFDTLTPKSVLNSYLSMLHESRRLVLCGPSGTGKTFLAHKLAEFLAIKHLTVDSAGSVPSRSTPLGDRVCPSGAIATFSVDHKNGKELRAYLLNIAEQCELDLVLPHSTLPTVLILDNLHHSADSLADILQDLNKISLSKSPYIIGTINQSALNHCHLFDSFNVRWAVFSHHSEPVKGFLARYLRRKLLEAESRQVLNQQKTASEPVLKVVEWVPLVCAHLNQYLEQYFGQSISIGPRLFTSCPIDSNGSQSWFTDLWNLSILPFVVENLREYVRAGNSLDGLKDPTEWLIQTYPWTDSAEWSDHLNRLRVEDILGEQVAERGTSVQHLSEKIDKFQLDSSAARTGSETQIKDPFLQMLLKLKEASE